MAGYESSCHINRLGHRLDMISLTQHDLQVRQDYALLRRLGISTARDAVRWHLIDRAGHYDFCSFLPMLDAAGEFGIQVIWDLCHYGWPDDLDVFSPAFIDRFARFSKAIAQVIHDRSDAVPFYTPVNEPSFLPWAIGRQFIHPFTSGRDAELKRQFIRATFAAIEAVRDVDPRARIVLTDPLVNVVPPREGDPELIRIAQLYRDAQFEAWDMIAAGGPDYLDIVGVNYYYSNQWEHCGERLRWEDNPRDSRMLAFSQLLAEVHARYNRPIVVSETGHYGEDQAKWIREIAAEIHAARNRSIPIEGVCLYPVIDRPDWEDLSHWHDCGLWRLRDGSDGPLTRVLNEDYAAEIHRIRAAMSNSVAERR